MNLIGTRIQFLLAFACVIFFASVLAEGAQRGGPPMGGTRGGPSRVGTISGIVVGRDGKPAGGIRVKSQVGTYKQVAITNEKGEFQLKDVVVGITTVSAWNWDDQAGVAPADGKRLLGVFPAVVEVKESQDTTLAEPIKLGPTVTVIGRAMGNNDIPLANQNVRVRMDVRWTGPAKFVGPETQTNARGEFTLIGVPMAPGVEINAPTRVSDGTIALHEMKEEMEGKEVNVGDLRLVAAPQYRRGRG